MRVTNRELGRNSHRGSGFPRLTAILAAGGSRELKARRGVGFYSALVLAADSAMTRVTQQEVDEAIREADDLIDRIGDQVTGTINDTTEDGEPITGRQVQHGQTSYQVVGSTSARFIQIQASFNAIETLAANRAVANSQGGQVQVTGPMIQSAEDTLDDRIDEEDLEVIREGLIRRTSRDDIGVQLDDSDGFVSGFQVTKKLFIYDDEISVSEFNSEVQSLANAFSRGKWYLVEQYDLNDGLDESSEGPRGFA